MKKLLIYVASVCMLASCGTKTVDNEELVDTVQSVDITKFHDDHKSYLVVNVGDTLLRAVQVDSTLLDSMHKMQRFDLIYKHNANVCKAINVIPADSSDTLSKNKLMVADGNEIDDFKMRSRKSYAIIDLPDGGMIVVSTPRAEISRMLRMDCYKFYYYRNWDGRYYFDHMEEYKEEEEEPTKD